MVKVNKAGIVLSKSELGFESHGVLNPAVIMHDGLIHMFYRAVSKGNYSTIGYCTLKDPFTVLERFDLPILFPQFEYESHGTEDPRIVKINDLFYLTYTAYDGINALGALATSIDLKHFDKKGIIAPSITFEDFSRLAETKKELNEKYLRYNKHDSNHDLPDKKILLWDKNIMFFPRRSKDKLHFLHRIRPDILIVELTELEDLTFDFWQNYFMHLSDGTVLSPKYTHEVSYLGGGCPPIETDKGWLLIYHGVHDTINGYVYSACAALLDIDNPQKEIARLPYPLFKPEMDWELKGEVNNVCFPTGTVLIEGVLYIYYGAADERIACASIVLEDLLTELLLNATQ